MENNPIVIFSIYFSIFTSSILGIFGYFKFGIAGGIFGTLVLLFSVSLLVLWKFFLSQEIKREERDYGDNLLIAEEVWGTEKKVKDREEDDFARCKIKFLEEWERIWDMNREKYYDNPLKRKGKNITILPSLQKRITSKTMAR